ncbi:hypothetical protein ACQP2E_26575 [Actinoplanes sp. CA-015351]|uniref:hypothetical protein n=1 Tax=Actinoplanes sp. CA-015351 TaxID=3239897 RepID=UPI003D96AA46
MNSIIRLLTVAGAAVSLAINAVPAQAVAAPGVHRAPATQDQNRVVLFAEIYRDDTNTGLALQQCREDAYQLDFRYWGLLGSWGLLEIDCMKRIAERPDDWVLAAVGDPRWIRQPAADLLTSNGNPYLWRPPIETTGNASSFIGTNGVRIRFENATPGRVMGDGKDSYN